MTITSEAHNDTNLTLNTELCDLQLKDYTDLLLTTLAEFPGKEIKI